MRADIFGVNLTPLIFWNIWLLGKRRAFRISHLGRAAIPICFFPLTIDAIPYWDFEREWEEDLICMN